MQGIYDKVPEKLEKDKEYTEAELVKFMLEHPNVKIISKTHSRLQEYSNKKFKIVDVFDAYVHYSERGCYHIPSTSNRIYLTE